jgi:hypothetical protein
MKPPRKTKPSEPSLRTKLSQSFLETLEEDFRLYGKAVIEEMRQKDPTRYAELAGKLIMATEPPVNAISFKEAESLHEIAVRLLQSFGVREPDEDSIQQAMEANTAFIDRLTAIAACAQASTDEIH